MAIHFDTQGPAPDGFHTPTVNEWNSLISMFSNLGGSNQDEVEDALKMPKAGERFSTNGSMVNGHMGFYWSSTPDFSFEEGYYVSFGNNHFLGSNRTSRCIGMQIRPFKNNLIIPDSSWTMLYGTSISVGGIFWNLTKGLISISDDGQTWITISDKNLGATQVWNRGDTQTQDNCGGYYQRGNNYMFPREGDISVSSTQVDANGYGPGNYYYSDTFITGKGWDSSSNDNLWGGVSQGTRGYPDMRLHGAVQTFHRAPKPPTSITLNESAIIFSAVGDTQQLTAIVSPGDATKDFIWASNDTSVATVSQNGLVTCVSLGNCVITCSAKYGSAIASCSVIQPENVTMTNTSYHQGASYSSLTETLFTASKTGYYHITGQFYSNSGSSGATGATHSLSGGTKISGTDSGWVDPYKTLAVDCVYYIESGTDFKGYVETYGYTSGGGRNFAAVYYGSYDPTPDLYPGA